MTPADFPEQSIIVAKDQPEYMPLPAHIDRRFPAQTMTFCWRLTWRERLKLLFTGKLWHQVMTFGMPLQPQLLLVEKPRLE